MIDHQNFVRQTSWLWFHVCLFRSSGLLVTVQCEQWTDKDKGFSHFKSGKTYWKIWLHPTSVIVFFSSHLCTSTKNPCWWYIPQTKGLWKNVNSNSRVRVHICCNSGCNSTDWACPSYPFILCRGTGVYPRVCWVRDRLSLNPNVKGKVWHCGKICLFAYLPRDIWVNSCHSRVFG